jgi:hypothetical protein
MITIPSLVSGRMLFCATRNLIAWRLPSNAWLIFKPPWNPSLVSERLSLSKTLWSWKGFRIIRHAAV